MARACVCDDYFTVSDEGELCLKAGTMGLRRIVRYATPGTFQFKKDDYPWLARVFVRVQGAGGGSAGADAASGQCIVRPGGGGGGYTEALIEASVLSGVETVVVGEGGTAGGTNSPGGSGGASSFGGVTALGGDGGHAAQDSGTTVDGSTGAGGAPPGVGGTWAQGGGHGGGAVRLSGAKALSGAGGDSFMGQGGRGIASEGSGTAPRGYGAGAGGALSFGDPMAGGRGGNGLVLVYLYG